MRKIVTFTFTGVILGLTFLVLPESVMAQPCGPNTPSLIADLSTNPDTLWISSNIIRNDTCCGATNPDKCLEIILTLHPDVEGIIFDIYSGAVPPGALFYQINCGPPVNVGDPICLSGPGPHQITFCKPGNNANEYSLQTITSPDASGDIVVNEGCFDSLMVSGLDLSTITWTSINPGAPGDYDSYLSCTSGCDTVEVQAQPGYPAFVDFEVCGMPIGGCNPTPFCDTIRTTFNSTLVAEILPENPTVCFGSPGTFISANGTGGTPPYNYSWSTGETTDSIFVGVGSYSVILGDSSGCPPTSDSVVVTEFTQEITADAGSDILMCRDDLPVSLSGTVTGASGGTWSGGSGIFNPSPDSLTTSYSPSASENTAGVFELYLTTTGNGTCPAAMDTILITLVNFNASVSLSTSDVSCYGGSDGTASISLSGGAAPYSFIWNTPGTASGNIATGLPSGTYDVTIADGNGCDSVFPFTITEPTELNLIIDSTDALCGDANGSSTIIANGGTAPYFYQWGDGQTSATATGLGSGIYAVTVSDDNGCTKDTSTIVNNVQPSISITDTIHITCPGANDGSATVTPSSGQPPYAYLWENGQSDSTATGLAPGPQYVTVSDDNGCVAITFAVINSPPEFLVLTDSVAVSCTGGNDGSASVNVSGGTSPYSYQWDSGTGSQTLSTAFNLSVGIYSVTVTDDSGCTTDTIVEITQPDELEGLTSFNAVSCNGGNDGMASVLISGGTAPYDYQWSSAAGSQTNAAATGLSAGMYSITTSDANNCVLIQSVSVTEPAALTLSGNAINITCNGGSNGSVSVTTSGGTSPYSYYWTANANNQTNAQATGLSTGIYTVTVTDSSNCTISLTDTLSSPNAVVVTLTGDDTVCVNTPANLSATASGGTGGYSYNWSEAGAVGPSIQVFPQATATYSVTATDNSGCAGNAANHTVFVKNIFQDSIVASSAGNVCSGQSTAVSGYFNGTSGPYTFNWSHGLGSGAGPHPITAVGEVIYEYTATDICGNSISDTVLVIGYPYPQVQTSPDSVEGCAPFTVSFSNNNSSNATIAYYYWEFGDGMSSDLPNPAHTYQEDGYYQVSLMVVSENGCTTAVSGSSYISVFPSPIAGFTASPKRTDIRTPSFNFTSTSQGALDYQWSFGEAGSTSTEEHPVYTYSDTGTYHVTLSIVNEYGCTDEFTETVIIDPYYTVDVPNAFTPNHNGPNGGLYDINSLDNTIFFPVTQYVVDFHMMIYNRWGELVFESFDVDLGWDGYYRGQLSQQDVYVWKIKVRFADGNEVTKVGDLTLLR